MPACPSHHHRQASSYAPADIYSKPASKQSKGFNSTTTRFDASGKANLGPASYAPAFQSGANLSTSNRGTGAFANTVRATMQCSLHLHACGMRTVGNTLPTCWLDLGYHGGHWRAQLRTRPTFLLCLHAPLLTLDAATPHVLSAVVHAVTPHPPFISNPTNPFKKKRFGQKKNKFNVGPGSHNLGQSVMLKTDHSRGKTSANYAPQVSSRHAKYDPTNRVYTSQSDNARGVYVQFENDSIAPLFDVAKIWL